MKPIFFLFIISLILSACASQTTVVPQATVTLPTNTPIRTQTPLPIPTSEFYFILTNVQAVFEQAGIPTESINSIENATYSAEGGLAVVGVDGTVYSYSNEELKDRVFYDDGFLKVVNSDGTEVEFVYDYETNQFLHIDDWVKFDSRGFLISNVSDLSNFVNKGKLFTLPGDLTESSNISAPILIYGVEGGEEVMSPFFEEIDGGMDWIIGQENAVRNLVSPSSGSTNPEFFQKLFKIEGLGDNVMVGVPVTVPDSQDYVRVMVYDLGGYTVIAYVDENRELKTITLGVDANTVLLKLRGF